MSGPTSRLFESTFRHVTDTGDEIEETRQYNSSGGFETYVKITRSPKQSLTIPAAMIDAWLWLLEHTKVLIRETDDVQGTNTLGEYPHELVSAARAFSVCPCPSNLATLKDSIESWGKKK